MIVDEDSSDNEISLKDVIIHYYKSWIPFSIVNVYNLI